MPVYTVLDAMTCDWYSNDNLLLEILLQHRYEKASHLIIPALVGQAVHKKY
jgi:Holliday junction resolvase RusA-like endonuclease